MTLSTDELKAIFYTELSRLRSGNGTKESPWLDWDKLRANVHDDDDWIVDGLWPAKRQVHVHAARKTGKSLITLYMAAKLSIGVDPFTGRSVPARRMGYLDFEMDESDVRARLEAMDLLKDVGPTLLYGLHPMIPKLDTPAGGETLLKLLLEWHIEALCVDTLSRVVSGDENSNDTYIRFYQHTGMLLKQHGIALFRLDHEGHNAEHSRGASAKADDVDLVWRLTRTTDGLEFKRMAARQNFIPERICLTEHTDPLRYSTGLPSWTEAAINKAREIDGLGLPDDAGQRIVRQALKDAQLKPGDSTVLAEAIKLRKTRFPGISNRADTSNPDHHGG